MDDQLSPPHVWQEYDAVAEQMARRGLKGCPGDALPDSASVAVIAEIEADPEAFEDHVSAFAYALAMESIET